jgi:DNA-binding winged helix-turn-helix (wHTH) protein
MPGLSSAHCPLWLRGDTLQASILFFDQFELDLNSYELRKSGRVIKLEKLPMELLILLAEKQGQLVTRQQIIQRLWGDNVFVDTRQGINTAVRKVRLALHDDPEHPRFLQTVAGRGYRLLAPVSGPGITSDRGAEVPPLLPAPIVSPVETPAAAASISTTFRQRLILTVATMLVVLTAGVFWSPSRRQTKNRPLAEQRITSNSPEAPIKFAVVSPDGKYVAYSDPNGLYLRQIDSGETRPWVLPKDFLAFPNSWFPANSWFPDGTHLLVTRVEGREPSRTLSLWKLSILGGNPQKLMDNAAAGAVSPDGSRIAFLPGQTGLLVSTQSHFGGELWLMDSDGTNARKIAESGSRDHANLRGSWIFRVAWSPGGQRIAYIECHGAAAPEPAEDTFSLLTRDANGGDPQVVLKDDPGLGPALWWAADGRILYAYRGDPSSERGDEGINSISVDERTGKAVDQPQPVTEGQGSIGGLNATSDGTRLVLWRGSTTLQAFIGRFEAGSHQFKAPRRLTLDTNGSIAEAWTSDSKAVLFVSNRNGTWKLFKQNIDEAAAEVLVEGRSKFLPRLSADGSQVLYLAASKPGDVSFPASLMSKPLAGGPPRRVLQEKGIINYQCARTPSDLCIFSKLVGSDLIFVSFDLEHGAGRELTRIPNGYTNWSLSPDGSRLAVFLDRHLIRFISPITGAAKDVVVKDWPLFAGDWSADSKSVFMPSVTPEFTPVILAIKEAGMAEVVLEGNANTNFAWMIQSPDGRYGILEMPIPGDNNAWMVDRF